MMMRNLLAAALLLATQRETTTVEVVQVPVYVSANGAALSGLTKDNFELYVNGKRQTIDYFDVVDFAAPAAAPAPAVKPADAPAASPSTAHSDLRQRRLYLFLFDLVYSSDDAITRAQRAAAGYLKKAAPADSFAVGMYTETHGIDILLPFTTDRRSVNYIIHRLGITAAADPARLAVAYPKSPARLVDQRPKDGPEAPRGTEDDGITNTSEIDFDADVASGPADPPVFRSVAHETLKDPQRRLLGHEMDALSQMAGRLASFEGHRHVVLLSSSFNAALMHGGGSANTVDLFGSATSPRNASMLQISDPEVTRSLKAMIRSFNSAGVFLDAIDIAGVRASWSSSSDSEGLTVLARDTGGQVVLNHNDLGQAIQTLADSQRIVYTLAFHAKDTGKADNSISVKLKNVPRGVSMTYRPGYSTVAPKATASDPLRLADILENDIPQTGVNLQVRPLPSGGNAAIDVELPAGELIALSGGKPVAGDILLYVYSGRRVAAFKAKRLVLDPAKLDAARPLHLQQDFGLPPGRYTAKVLLRLDGSDAVGFATTSLGGQP
jgi:VWFA-related protein